MASYEEVRDLDQRLTELEFRIRLFDRATVPRDPADAPSPRTERALPRETTEPRAADTGRTGRWRRPRSDPGDV